MAKQCAIPGCEAGAKDHQLMCWPHWCRVPKALNREVFATFAAVQRNGRNERPYVERRGEYLVARAAAIDAVVAKEATGGPTATRTCIEPGCSKRTIPTEPFCEMHR